VLIGLYKGQVYIADVKRFRCSPRDTENHVKLTAQTDGKDVRVRMEEEPGSSGKGYIAYYARDILPGYDFKGTPSRKNKVLRWTPLASALQAGNVFLLEGEWNSDFIDELDQCKGEDEKNDQADAASGGLDELTTGMESWSLESIRSAVPVIKPQQAGDWSPPRRVFIPKRLF
jgi:predicted phage terminase large subunit-like protein